MRMGVHRGALAPSLAAADEVWLYAPNDLGWDLAEVIAHCRAVAGPLRNWVSWQRG